RRAARHHLSRRRPDRLDADRLDRLLALGGRADPAAGTAQLRDDADLSARAHAAAAGAARRHGARGDRAHRRARGRAHARRPGGHPARGRRPRADPPRGAAGPARRATAPQPLRGAAHEAALGGAVIERLRIRNLAIVEETEIAFGPGLNVLTGETGAGKSIVLGALGLLAGARADALAVRDGADEAVVEAVLRVAGQPAFEAALRERGLEAEEGELIVARTIARSGRSRATVGGRLVPIATLAELLGDRIEISS